MLIFFFFSYRCIFVSLSIIIYSFVKHSLAASVSQGRPASEKMKLSNMTGQSVAFKIKTTAPRRYCVRPNSGVLSSKGHIEITVSLQTDADLAEARKDKFLIESFEVCEDPSPGLIQQLWSTTPPDTIFKQKFRCRIDDNLQAAFLASSQAPTSPSPSSATESLPKQSAKPISPASASQQLNSPALPSTSAQAPKSILSDSKLSDVDLRQVRKEIDEKNSKAVHLEGRIKDLESNIASLRSRASPSPSPAPTRTASFGGPQTSASLHHEKGYTAKHLVLIFALGALLGLLLGNL
eukprot:TRINITY_DN1105_c0_g1_i4.p1 TRINITY_DN1105_c0_g1~~TRINITY_DN1105_c0_g1_i4.p1  ORF type:complete len:294 (-),score=70.61 TRINITY_DN1105_c0_g1_i4:664-1545(-)